MAALLTAKRRNYDSSSCQGIALVIFASKRSEIQVYFFAFFRFFPLFFALNFSLRFEAKRGGKLFRFKRSKIQYFLHYVASQFRFG